MFYITAGVMVSSVLVVVVPGFQNQLDQTKGYTIGICFFSTKYITSMRKSKDWFARYHDYVSQWSNISTRMSVR